MSIALKVTLAATIESTDTRRISVAVVGDGGGRGGSEGGGGDGGSERVVVATAVVEGPATCQQMRRVASLVVVDKAAGENGWERMEV